ncbi:signal peptidase I [Polyangium sorediatum]|uniref:Signal peptidase I n=1 Tax=Polyangium sorediatum TaxID=889274 RepID=A0ABT6NRT4_9BACT|nr:signal peptidase I [Polyangium sorediatum]MDI1430996.1 signal peptidase I [Polyangium sorediatum]
MATTPDERSPESSPALAKEGGATEGSDPSPSHRPNTGSAGPTWLRGLFYAIWIVTLPFVLAILAVWLLTPAPGDVSAGGLRVFVAEQQIPAGIVLFTIFAMLAWHYRYELPLSSAIGVGRKDIPPQARARYEEAQALVDEARRILKQNARDVVKGLRAAERERLDEAISGLEKVMNAETFDLAEFDTAHARADRAVGEHLSRWRKGEMREYAESIGVAVAVALILRAFVIEAFKIPSGSMIPSLMIGDHIFVNKLTYGPLIPWTEKRLFSSLPPTRGDVMVFKFPENKEQDFIKRVIAAPGDTLEAINGRPIINGWLVPHCYVGRYGNDGWLYVEFLEDKSYLTLFAHDDMHPNGPDEPTCKGQEECGIGQSCKAGICGHLQGSPTPFKVNANEVWVMGDNRYNSHDSRSWRGGLGAGVPFENIKGRAMFVWMSFAPGGGIAQDRLFVNVMGRPKLPGGLDASLQAGLDKCMRERPPVSQTTPPPGRKLR